MNLDLYLVQKVIDSLFKNDTTISSLSKPSRSEHGDAEEGVEYEESPVHHNRSRSKSQKSRSPIKHKHKPVITTGEKQKQKGRRISNIFTMFYEKMNIANVYVNTQKNSGCFEHQETTVDIDSQIPRPKSFSNSYITSEISEYIKNESKKIITFECKINNRLIRLHFIIFKNNKELISYYKVLAHRVYMWLSIISEKSTCVDELIIYVYLTPFEKKMPAHNNSIGPEHANTGYTYRCEKQNEIIIYRQEEWFKVLIHETMHSFGCDFEEDAGENDNADKYLRTLFSLPDGIIIKLSETYSEIWARIMNVVFQTYFKAPPSLESRTPSAFKKNLDLYLHLESMFSLYQCIKILDFMGINYNTLTDDSHESKQIILSFYRENTNVFAYYVLTSILLNNNHDFLSWCANHNGAGLNIFKIKTNQDNFVNLIKSCYKKSDLLTQIVETESKIVRDYKKAITNRELLKTLRMTIVGFD